LGVESVRDDTPAFELRPRDARQPGLFGQVLFNALGRWERRSFDVAICILYLKLFNYHGCVIVGSMTLDLKCEAIGKLRRSREDEKYARCKSRKVIARSVRLLSPTPCDGAVRGTHAALMAR